MTFFRHDDTIYKPHIDRNKFKTCFLSVKISVAGKCTLKTKQYKPTLKIQKTDLQAYEVRQDFWKATSKLAYKGALQNIRDARSAFGNRT